MGRKVYGVDLEESPFGGLIRKLLTEEELDMIADGGTAAGPGVAADGGSDENDETPSEDDAGTSDSDDAETDEDDWSVSDETYGSSREVGADDASPTGADLSESLGSGSSPPPSTDPGDSTGGYGTAGSTDYGGSSAFDDEFDEFDDEDDSGGIGGFLAAHKWLLLKVAVGLAALAAVGVVVWRYKDKLSGAVPGRGGDADESFDVDEDSGSPDVSPARRRAKADEVAGETPPPDGRDGRDTAADERTGPDERPGSRPSRERTPDTGSLGEDVDMGALVGLGTLAVIAALVRKFDEERNRPHDPLVDGPLDDEDADLGDDDQ